MGMSKVRTKRSGVLLIAHLACTILAHFASQVRTLSILQLAPFPSVQVSRVQVPTFVPYLCTSFSALESKSSFQWSYLLPVIAGLRPPNLRFANNNTTAPSLFPSPLAPPWRTCRFMSPPPPDHNNSNNDGSIDPKAKILNEPCQ